MNPTWTVELDTRDRRTLGAIRLCHGVEAAQTDDAVWVRGDERTPLQSNPIRCLPAAARYHVIDADRLVRDGATVPCAKLPEARWVAIREFVVIATPPAALPGRLDRRPRLTLRRSPGAQAANVMVTGIRQLADFVDRLPGFRIKPWRLAVRHDGRALVWGEPLPSVGGEYFHESHGIALPLGYELEPAIDRKTLRHLIGMTQAELVVVHTDGVWQRVDGESLRPASRAAIRLAAEGDDHGDV